MVGPHEEQVFRTRSRLTMIWAHRPLTEADQPDVLIAALDDIEIAPETFVWIAAEARVARNLRGYLADIHQQPLDRLKAFGYWVRGETAAHGRIR